MAKYRDNQTPRTKATLIKRKRGEGWEARHRRRFAIAQNSSAIAMRWAEEHGWEFSVKNNGHHFIFHRPGDNPREHFAQWWPQTAKLVIKHECHDIHQVIAEIEARA